MGTGDQSRRQDRDDRWCPAHQESLPCKQCKADSERAQAREIVAKSGVKRERTAVASEEARIPMDANVQMFGEKVRVLSKPENVKYLDSFVSLLTETEGTLEKSLRLFADAYRAVPDAKAVPPSVEAMLREMGKKIPSTRTLSEKLQLAFTKLSVQDRVEVSKVLEIYLNRADRRGKKTA